MNLLEPPPENLQHPSVAIGVLSGTGDGRTRALKGAVSILTCECAVKMIRQGAATVALITSAPEAKRLKLQLYHAVVSSTPKMQSV